MKGKHTLTGTITEVNTAYNEQFNNVTVTMKVEGLEQYPIQCYRLTNGEGVNIVDKLGVGDKITVTGAIKNYNGTVEYDAGCTVDAYELAPAEDPTGEQPSDPTEEPTNPATSDASIAVAALALVASAAVVTVVSKRKSIVK
jgi:hypothetical protein